MTWMDRSMPREQYGTHHPIAVLWREQQCRLACMDEYPAPYIISMRSDRWYDPTYAAGCCAVQMMRNDAKESR